MNDRLAEFELHRRRLLAIGAVTALGIGPTTTAVVDEHDGEFDDLRREFDEENTSVNVHTEQHPAGEILGQIEVVADVVSALVDDEPKPDFVDAVADQVRLEYGETATLSTGVEATVHGVYVTAVAGDEKTIERDAFAWVEVEAFNRSDDPLNLPHGSHFDVIFADQQVGWEIRAPAYQEAARERFDGEEVQGGVRRDGYIVFEVDEGIGGSSIDVLRDDFLAGVNVRWTAE